METTNENQTPQATEQNQKPYKGSHKGQPMRYGVPMVEYNLRVPTALIEQLKDKAAALSTKANKKITVSDLIRTACKRLLREL
jgi:hypothetical protein